MTGKVRQGKLLTCNEPSILPDYDAVLSSNSHMEEGDSDSSLIVPHGVFCQETFDRKEDLAYHKLICHDPRKRIIVCKPHNKTYSKINSAQRHWKEKHPNEKKPDFYDEKVRKKYSELISPVDLWDLEKKTEIGEQKVWVDSPWYENEMQISAHYIGATSGDLWVKARWEYYPHRFFSTHEAMELFPHRFQDLMMYISKMDIVHTLYSLDKKPTEALYDGQKVQGIYNPNRYSNVNALEWAAVASGKSTPIGLLTVKIYETRNAQAGGAAPTKEQIKDASKLVAPSQQNSFEP